MNFIIPVYCNTATTYSFVDPFLTTCRIDVADFGNYEIHSVSYYFLTHNPGVINGSSPGSVFISFNSCHCFLSWRSWIITTHLLPVQPHRSEEYHDHIE